jgi:hypothetical protein
MERAERVCYAANPPVKSMKQRVRSPARWLALSWLISLGCTQLEDPNQWFGDIVGGSGGELSGGSAGLGDSGAGMGGIPASSGTGGRSAGGSSGHAGAGTAGAIISHGSAGEAGAGSDNCEDASGFQGLGCYRCAPQEIVTLENACTTAICIRFDDSKRLTLLGADGKLPPLPGPTTANGGASAGGAAGAAGNRATGGSNASGSSAGGSSAGGSSAGTGGSAGTGRSCADLANLGTVVYITGSSAALPFLRQIAQQLVAQNVYIVYESTGSCIGVDAILNGTLMTTGPGAPALSATYWDSAVSPGLACDLPAEGVTADIGASDVFAQSCTGFEFANLDALQVRDAHGPIQTMTFAVPTNSAYSEISARAAYFAFGFGADGGLRDANGDAAIWNDENFLFKRSASSGTQAMLAAAIGVPASAWKGKAHKGSGDVAASLQAAAQKPESANAALGILAADYIDTNNLRAQIRVLAFQDTDQQCAVFPDSSSTAKDKRNVRDGHYPVWGPLHLLLRVDGQGKPLNAENRQAVTDIIAFLSGTKALPNKVQLLDLYAQSGLVPECAMHVTRSKDGGNIFPYQPSSPCSCLFDVKAVGSTSCTECKVQGDCASGETCSQGYCER